MKKAILAVLVLGLVAWLSAPVASAQGEVNDVVIQPRSVHNDDPKSTFDSLKALPVVALADTKVSHPGMFANRHDVAVSRDGETPAAFGIDDEFDFSFDLVLIGTPIGPRRKEAGIIVVSTIGGDGQFIVNTDAHEVVAFGGPFPFYRFEDMMYNSGDLINLRVRYFHDEDRIRKIEYFANDVSSGPLAFDNTEQGIPGPFFVKGYMQVAIDTNAPQNRSVAVFDSIRWNGRLIGD